MPARHYDRLVAQLTVLVVDDNVHTRKLVRMLLINLGVKTIYEAADGVAALDIVRHVSPDLMVLDWEMPMLDGPQLVRIVRSPGVFPTPDLPIIMLSGYAERWRVSEALKIGVNEFLVKPISPKALLDRIMAIIAKPRPMVKVGKYYGPAPRKLLPQTA